MTAIAPSTTAVEQRPQRRSRAALTTGLVVLLGVLALVCFFSITMGARGVGLSTIWKAFNDYDPTNAAETVIRELRVPRTLIGIFAGAGLGLCGAILQGVTRNPLADPGILGIASGSATAIVFGIMVLGTQSVSTYVWFAFVGAGVATVTVYGIASFGREGATPVKLALAGAAVGAILSSITSAIVMTNVSALNELRFWQVGALSGRYFPVFWQTLPFLLVGIVLALGAGRALNGLALGEDLAKALGQRVPLTRATMFVIVALLCGAATSACGPIVFVGLIVPHLARMFCGPDYRWILAYSLLLTPIVMLVADIIGRVIVSPGELQVGVVLGVIGAPFFILLVRYRNLTEL